MNLWDFSDSGSSAARKVLDSMYHKDKVKKRDERSDLRAEIAKVLLPKEQTESATHQA